jgi:hypothetical protein
MVPTAKECSEHYVIKELLPKKKIIVIAGLSILKAYGQPPQLVRNTLY